MTEAPLLHVQKVVKTFPGTVALKEVDFDLERGEVHAIVGENGAGKSTLMKILSGVYQKDSGTIVFDGNLTDLGNVETAQSLGISMIYQEMENVPQLTVAENIFLGRLPIGRVPGFVSFKTLFQDARQKFRDFKIDIEPERRLALLTTAEQQFVEIVKAVTAKNARVIIMDEPTSSLTIKETEKLFSIIGELKKRSISIIYISHRLDEVTSIADRLSVFRDGRNQGTLKRHEFDPDRIVSLMIGYSLETTRKKKVERRNVVFEVKRIAIRNRITTFSMRLYEGEILGIAGLMGSGKDELVRSLFGLWPAQVYFLGKRVIINHPADAVKYGIVYLPEERKLQALFSELSVRHNISPLWLLNSEKTFLVNNKKEADLGDGYIRKLAIRTPSGATRIMALSGGNQQKAIFSRLLAVRPKLMILNDPTRGIDVGSKEEIYNIIVELSSAGTSILVLSSEIPEIGRLANRVIVLSRGSICAEFSDEEVTTENVLRAATRLDR
jgi:ribose transport system ATP-binding protein